METSFHVLLSIKTETGFENFGKFFLGNDGDAAQRIFHQLKGSREVSEENILHAELTEMRNDLPVNVQMISCTLEELAENCRIITKEVFRLFITNTRLPD